MNHHHVGPDDEACPGCLDEADEGFRKKARRKTVAGVAILIALVIGSMVALSWYLNSHGPHLR